MLQSKNACAIEKIASAAKQYNLATYAEQLELYEFFKKSSWKKTIWYHARQYRCSYSEFLAKFKNSAELSEFLALDQVELYGDLRRDLYDAQNTAILFNCNSKDKLALKDFVFFGLEKEQTEDSMAGFAEFMNNLGGTNGESP